MHPSPTRSTASTRPVRPPAAQAPQPARAARSPVGPLVVDRLRGVVASVEDLRLTDLQARGIETILRIPGRTRRHRRGQHTQQ